MEFDRLPKRIFYGDLNSGKSPKDNPTKKVYKIGENLKELDMKNSDDEPDVLNQNKLKCAVRTGCNVGEEKRIQISDHKVSVAKEHL